MLEGTPEELAVYLKLQAGQQPSKFVGPTAPRTGEPYTIPSTTISTTGVDAGKYPRSDQGPYTLDKSKLPNDWSKRVSAYNSDLIITRKSAFAMILESLVRRNTKSIS